MPAKHRLGPVERAVTALRLDDLALPLELGAQRETTQAARVDPAARRWTTDDLGTGGAELTGLGRRPSVLAHEGLSQASAGGQGRPSLLTG